MDCLDCVSQDTSNFLSTHLTKVMKPKKTFTRSYTSTHPLIRRMGLPAGDYEVEIRGSVAYFENIKTKNKGQIDFNGLTGEEAKELSQQVHMPNQNRSKEKSNVRKETVQFQLPDGNVVTVVLVDREGLDKDGGVTMEPVADNPNHVHHHAFEDRNGDWNILIRDRFNKNLAAFILNKRNGRWTKRALTDAEKRR